MGRLGCLLAGCCYGHPTDMPWGITFTNPLAAANVGTPLGVSLHPTQLYESVAALVILGILLAFENRGRPFAGRTFWTYLLLYPVVRFVIEFYRGDPRGTVIDVLSTSQFVSLLLVPLSIVMLVLLARAGGSTQRRATARAGALTGPPVASWPPATAASRHRPSTSTSKCSRDDAGVRLDQFLAARLGGRTRSQIQRLIRDGLVRLDRTAARPGIAVRPGDLVRVDIPAPAPATPRPEALPLDIVYDDTESGRRQQAGRHGGASGRGSRGRHPGQRNSCTTYRI